MISARPCSARPSRSRSAIGVTSSAAHRSTAFGFSGASIWLAHALVHGTVDREHVGPERALERRAGHVGAEDLRMRVDVLDVGPARHEPQSHRGHPAHGQVAPHPRVDGIRVGLEHLHSDALAEGPRRGPDHRGGGVQTGSIGCVNTMSSMLCAAKTTTSSASLRPRIAYRRPYQRTVVAAVHESVCGVPAGGRVGIVAKTAFTLFPRPAGRAPGFRRRGAGAVPRDRGRPPGSARSPLARARRAVCDQQRFARRPASTPPCWLSTASPRAAAPATRARRPGRGRSSAG